MCDETTEAENEAYLERVRLNRREVGVGAGAVVATLLTGCSSTPGPSDGPAPTSSPATTGSKPEEKPPEPVASTGQPTNNRMVTIDTPDGSAEAFFVAPESGKHPGVIMWPDVAGLRKAYETMATRLAGEGYAVLAVNPYYRSSKLPILSEFAEWRTPEGKAKIKPMREALTPEGIAKDGAAFVAWLDQQKEVDTGKKLAAMGYCMSGSFTFRAAAAAPERVGAIASFHGGGLVTDEPTSPHTLFPKMKAAALICIAQNDHERDPKAKPALEQATEKAGITAEIEVYPAQHGWCTIDSPVYDEKQAEKAWARMLATFGQHL
jgi:carboxymethylenebutenolidase